MRWPIFIIFVYVMLVFEQGLTGVLAVGWLGDAEPSFLLILTIYIALSAPRVQAAWAAVIIGLVADLSPPALRIAGSPDTATDLALIGPGVAGHLFGALIALELRHLIFRDSTIALATMVFVCGLFVHLLMVAILALRNVGYLPAEPIGGFHVADQLLRRFWMLLYSALMALPIGVIFHWLDPIWHFQSHDPSQRSRGR